MTQIVDAESQTHAARDSLPQSSKIRSTRPLGSLVRHGALVITSALLILPFFWMIASSIKDNAQMFAQPIVWWPLPGHLSGLPLSADAG